MIEKNWLKIGEVSKSLGISPKELRYWESVIPEIRPRRSKGNLRYYHREELPRLAHIRDWLGEGLTVADCQQLLLTGQLKRGLGLEVPTVPMEAAPSAGLELARIALTELLERLNAVPPPRRGPRRRPQPKAPPKAQASPDAPAAPVPVEPAVPDPPPARKPRRKPEPSDSGSFGPLFDLL